MSKVKPFPSLMGFGFISFIVLLVLSGFRICFFPSGSSSMIPKFFEIWSFQPLSNSTTTPPSSNSVIVDLGGIKSSSSSSLLRSSVLNSSLMMISSPVVEFINLTVPFLSLNNFKSSPNISTIPSGSSNFSNFGCGGLNPSASKLTNSVSTLFPTESLVNDFNVPSLL